MPHQCTDCGRGFEDGSKEMLSGCPNCGGTTFQFKPEGRDEEPPEESPSPPEPPESEVDSTVARTVGNAATAVRDFMGGSGSSNPDDGFGSEAAPSQSSASTPTQASSDDPSVSSGGAETSPSPGQETGQSPAASSGRGGDSSVPSEEYVQPPSSSSGDVPQRSPQQRGDDPDSHPHPDRSRNDPSGSSGIAADTSSYEDSAQASARSDVVPSDDLPPAPESPVRESPTPVDDQPTPDASQSTPDTEDQPDLEELREQLNEQFESIRVLAPGQYELNLMELYDREEYIIALQEDGKYTIQVPERWKD